MPTPKEIIFVDDGSKDRSREISDSTRGRENRRAGDERNHITVFFSRKTKARAPR